MNYCKVKAVDIANGCGVRVSLFVAGCDRHCAGCFNAETWPFDAGKPFDEAAQQAVLEALEPYWVDGLSVLGGEPLDPRNLPDVAAFVARVKKQLPSKDVWLYTGYTWEELAQFVPETLLKNIDVLVDGPFVEELKDISLAFRGSSNQRIYRLIDGNPTPWEGGFGQKSRRSKHG